MLKYFSPFDSPTTLHSLCIEPNKSNNELATKFVPQYMQDRIKLQSNLLAFIFKKIKK